MLSKIKKLIPRSLLRQYHKILSLFAAFIYDFPSEKMIVVGVTGTNGKTTTVNLIARVLESGGAKVGLTSTVNFKVAEKEWLNNKKMTMLGRFQLQSLLKQMIDAGCKYAVIETSSQGIEQYRHLGINYDYAVFTKLSPEHIEAHGGFENYKRAKLKLFAHLAARKNKVLDGTVVKKVIVVNSDDQHAAEFLNNVADKKIIFSTHDNKADLLAENISVSAQGTSFYVQNKQINLQLIGAFNVYNSLPAIAIGLEEKIDFAKIKNALENIPVVPGRTERIDEGQDFNVIVDYAPEPASMAQLYETVELIEKNKIIHVFGSCGGGRDVARRPVLGRMVGEKADIAIVTNEDPYDDDPMEIINQVVAGCVEMDKIVGATVFPILDRAEAIRKAIDLASTDDLVLVTGKGAEQAMAVANGKYVPWDDRTVIRDCLRKKLESQV